MMMGVPERRRVQRSCRRRARAWMRADGRAFVRGVGRRAVMTSTVVVVAVVVDAGTATTRSAAATTTTHENDESFDGRRRRGGGDGDGDDDDGRAPRGERGGVERPRRRSRKLADMSTSALYGFVIFYGIKIALKRLFAPVLLFTGTTQLLFRMRALRVSPGMMYDSFVKPYLPVEYRRNLEEFSVGALKSKAARNAMRDGWWDKQERRF